MHRRTLHRGFAQARRRAGRSQQRDLRLIAHRMERTTILLPPVLRERAALAARERGMSLAELIRECLQDVVDAIPADNGMDPLYTDDAVWT